MCESAISYVFVGLGKSCDVSSACKTNNAGTLCGTYSAVNFGVVMSGWDWVCDLNPLAVSFSAGYVIGGSDYGL